MILNDIGVLIYQNQLESISLMILCILFGYVLGRMGLKFGIKHRKK